MKNMMSGTSKRLLVVEDEPTIRRVLQRALRSAGYEVITAADGREALEIIFQEDIAVVLLDIMMPGISGLEVLRQLAANRPDVCVIMMTAVVETETVAAALKLGACDYIVKPFERNQVIFSVNRALEKQRLSQENKEYLGGKIEEDQIEITRAISLHAMISLVHAIEGKHGYTRGHSQRVAEISANLARDLGLPPERIEKIRQAALVHDIGKIWVSNALLNKTSCLTSEEMQHVHRYPETGEFILRRVVNDGDILRLVRNHHERYDGTGYPDKIQGEQIPIEVGIIALADAYDAMRSQRPYRSALNDSSALAELKNGRGTQFDPRVVDAFLKSSTGDNSCF